MTLTTILSLITAAAIVLTGITYFLRTRNKIPPELEELARAGGTVQVQRLDRVR